MFVKNFWSTSICLTLPNFQESKFYDIQNKMVVGKMKAVNKGILINKFIGLKPKIILCSWMMVKNLMQQKE